MLKMKHQLLLNFANSFQTFIKVPLPFKLTLITCMYMGGMYMSVDALRG